MTLNPLQAILREKSPLREWARTDPTAAARELDVAIAAASPEELKVAEHRQELIWALKHICHRRVSLEPVESALFRLAQGEAALVGGNATDVWKSLFYVVLNPTHSTIASRMDLLRRRLLQPRDRGIALRGLEVLASREAVGMAYTEDDKLDGEWPRPTRREIVEAKSLAWQWLMDLTDADDTLTAERARETVASLLRESLFLGIGGHVLQLLQGRVQKWSATSRTKLRETLDLIAAFDGTELRQSEDIWQLFEAIRTDAKPLSFEERLRDVVCRQQIFNEPIDWAELQRRQAQQDEAIVAEGLRSDIPILASLDMLVSADAIRGSQIGRVLGAADGSWLALEPLQMRLDAPRGEEVLAAYVLGLASGSQGAAVDKLLRSWLSSPPLLRPLVWALWQLRPSDFRLQLLRELVLSSDEAARAIPALGYTPWRDESSVEEFEGLLQILVSRDLPETADVGIALIMGRRSLGTETDEASLRLLGELVEQIASAEFAGMRDHYWKEACALLLKRGHTEAVARAAERAIRAGHFTNSDAGWELLEAVAGHNSELALRHVLSILGDAAAGDFRLGPVRDAQVLERLPEAEILAWVGSDEERAAVLAHGLNVHGPILSPLATGMISRFGADSAPSHALAAQAHSTRQAVHSLRGFAQEQLSNARKWAEGADNEVRRWCERRVEEFADDVERYGAMEKTERPRR